MRAVAALALLVALTTACRQAPEPYSPHPYIDEVADSYGIDYRGMYLSAWNGSKSDLIRIMNFSDLTDGCYAEAQTEALSELLQHLGDNAFAAAMSDLHPYTRNLVGGKVCHNFGYDAGREAEVENELRRRYPATAAIIFGKDA